MVGGENDASGMKASSFGGCLKGEGRETKKEGEEGKKREREHKKAARE